MKVLGTVLIVFASLVALAGALELAGPFLQERGMNVSGSLTPRWLMLAFGLIALVMGIRIRKAAAAEQRTGSEAEAASDDAGATA